MVSLGNQLYSQDFMFYPCIEQLVEGREEADYLHLTDEIDDVVQFIKEHPPLLEFAK